MHPVLTLGEPLRGMTAGPDSRRVIVACDGVRSVGREKSEVSKARPLPPEQLAPVIELLLRTSQRMRLP